MNENLDLVQMLKDCPEGTKLYLSVIDRRYIPVYRKMGREAFIKMIKRHHDLTPEIAMELAEAYMKPKSK